METSKNFWDKVKFYDFHNHLYTPSMAGNSSMNFGTYVNNFYKHILDANSRRMLTLVLYGKGKETKLNVDCDISYEKINFTILDLDHACINKTLP